MGLANVFLGIKLREEGIEQVMDNQTADWKRRYRESITRWLASCPRGHTFTSEDMRLIAAMHGVPRPHHPNAWAANAAANLRELARQGRIEPTGMYVTATLVASRGRALKQYRKIK